MGLIQLEGMEFYAYHGCFKEERVAGNHFVIDLSIERDLSSAAQTDNLRDTLNYQEAYSLIKKEMVKKSYLLEHIAERILKALYAKFQGIEKATVKVSKMNPPMGGKIKQVSVVLSK